VPFDLGDVSLQLESVAQWLKSTREGREGRIQALLRAANGVGPNEANERTRFPTGRYFLVAEVQANLLSSYGPSSPPEDWSVVAVDGSHIDVDRHLPVPCFLINLGGCILTYGSRPNAEFFSQPHLTTDPLEMYLREPGNSVQEEAISGPLLGLLRTVKELERLADVAANLPTSLPVLALVDGSLVLWGLSGQGYRTFVRDSIISDGLLPALEKLRMLAQKRPLALAAYVSLPRSTEVVNAVKCCLCPHEVARCRQSCSNRRSVLSPCDLANEFLDRELFQRLLAPGWRSPIYRTSSSVPRENYGDEQQVNFYYLNAGEEIGRVEVPQWVAQNEGLLALSHSLILDQCRRGQGYPVAISEAHEQAVIRTSDRRAFKHMMSEALESQGLTAYTSEKERSKRAPWV